MQSEYWGAGILLISIVLIIIGVPCTAIAWLGLKVIKKLSYYPSKTPAVQLSILFKLLVIEVISVALMLMFYNLMINL